MEQTESDLFMDNPDAAKVSIATAEYSVFEDTVKRSTAELHSALGAFPVADEELQQKLHAQFLKRDDSYVMSAVALTDDLSRSAQGCTKKRSPGCANFSLTALAGNISPNLRTTF